MAARTSRSLPAQITFILWCLAGLLVAFAGIVVLGVGVLVYQGITNDESAPTKTVAVQQDCGPSSTVPCTEREARLTLQAEVDSFAKPTVQKHLDLIKGYEQQLTDTRVAEARAKIEAEKSQWEADRYRKLQEEVQRPQPSTSVSPPGAISCDASPWTRALCDRAKR